MSNNEFIDEQIIEVIDQAEKPEEGPVSPMETDVTEIPPEERTIYTGIKIGGLWIEFEERLFVDDKIAMMVPKEFVQMSEESAKVKYPMEQRPGTILTNSAEDVNIVFNYLNESMHNDEVEAVRDQLFATMRRLNPGVKELSKGVEVVSDKNIAYVEFSNPVIDGKLYNLMYFLEVDGNTLIGNFNCLTKSTKYWKSSAFEMIQSIRIVDNREGQENE